MSHTSSPTATASTSNSQYDPAHNHPSDASYTSVDLATSALQAEWLAEQDQIKSKIITKNVHGFTLDSLQWVGGVDISFVEGSTAACGVMVVLDRLQGYEVAHVEKILVAHLEHPYMPGFLAFRELPVLRQLFTQLEASRRSNPDVPWPSVILVDGNGLLHPNKVGLACHLGVELDIPVVGVAKNLHAVDGLSKAGLEPLSRKVVIPGVYSKMLVGRTMGTLGAAVYKEDRVNPVFVSVGHKLDLDTAVRITAESMIYRVPEPTRQADILSRTECRSYRENVLTPKPKP